MFYASNTGLYGNDALERLTPVARTVIAPYPDRSSRYDDEGDDGWQSDRIAAALSRAWRSRRLGGGAPPGFCGSLSAPSGV